MSNIDKQALRQKAVKAGGEEWLSRKMPGPAGEYTVIVKGSLEKHPGWTTCRPVVDEVIDKKTMDFIAASNPATVLALLDENIQLQREKDAVEAVALALRDDMQDAREKLEAAERRIAELDQRLIEYAGIATREAHRVAELEARTVNLPAACADDEYFIDGVFQALRYERDIERAIIAAGIKVKES
ncbi:ead/Ea22-like family protein [Salmonella enterica]|nr:ead/Ea22-like family protein [Salmonella enterica]